MGKKAISLKKYLKVARKRPSKAIKLLERQPDLAKAIWKGNNKWIPGSTPLHWAAHDGHLKLVKRLVALGAEINAKEANWWCRPIDWAADSGQFKVVRYLIQQGAELGGDQWSNATPLHAAAQGGSTNARENSKAYEKTIKVLLKGGAEINAIATYGGKPPKLTPLDDAERVGNKIAAKTLIKKKAKRSKEL